MRIPIQLLALGLAVLMQPVAAVATITFTQLDDDVFVISHRVKVIGSRGKATKMVYTKAASLCVAAGYTHYRTLEQESEAGQQYQSANASVRVRFFQEDGDDRIGCERGADPQYVQEASTKLRKKGYTAPEPPAPPTSTGADAAGSPEGECTGGCTLEQVAAMARAGLSDEKIRAACAEDAS